MLPDIFTSLCYAFFFFASICFLHHIFLHISPCYLSYFLLAFQLRPKNENITKQVLISSTNLTYSITMRDASDQHHLSQNNLAACRKNREQKYLYLFLSSISQQIRQTAKEKSIQENSRKKAHINQFEQSYPLRIIVESIYFLG